MHLDATPFGSALQLFSRAGTEEVSLDHIWISQDEDELLMLWILINELSEKYLWNNVDFTQYVGSMQRMLHN